MLGPAELGGLLADLGADVIKVEPHEGDYGREMTWPIIKSHADGNGENSLLFLHTNRSKRSIALDLRTSEGAEVFRDLARGADAVIEAMRPGALARRGLGYDDLVALNPRLVYCSLSGYGATGPYKDMPSHGIAFDSWAGQMPVARDDEGFTYIPDHPSIGIHAGPAYAALAMVSAILQARATGTGCFIDIAQSDAAAYSDWLRIETWKSYERSDEEVHGNKADDFERRPPGTGGMREGVRYQVYESADGHVLLMASEQSFWRNFCTGLGRDDLFEKWPGSRYGDHARGNRELQAILRDTFRSRTTREWIAFGQDHDAPLAPVNTSRTVLDDPQFQERFPFVPHEIADADMLAFPAKFDGMDVPQPRRAPRVGEHTDDVLATAAGYDRDRIAALRAKGILK